MDKIRFRDLQRWNYTDIESVLPVLVRHDSQPGFVVLTVNDYNKLVKDYRQAQTVEGLPQ